MSETTISIRREGNRIAIETWVSDADYKGIANTSLLDPDAALRLFVKGAQLAHQVKAEAKP